MLFSFNSTTSADVDNARAKADARTRAQAASLQAQRLELSEVKRSEFYQRAFKLASADVLDRMVKELQLVASGRASRKFTDPKNSDMRNEAYAQAAAKQVQVLSGGRITMSLEEIARIKGDGRFE